MAFFLTEPGFKAAAPPPAGHPTSYGEGGV